jgi:6-O-methylguanine DNA methyltransferase, DNA binding domain
MAADAFAKSRMTPPPRSDLTRPDWPTVGLVVPCHRVIGADGSLTGYGGGIKRKRWLLRHEGIAIH